MEPVELGSGDCVAAGNAKYEIRRKPFACRFSADKRRLLLRGRGREKTIEGKSDGMRKGRGDTTATAKNIELWRSAPSAEIQRARNGEAEVATRAAASATASSHSPSLSCSHSPSTFPFYFPSSSSSPSPSFSPCPSASPAEL